MVDKTVNVIQSPIKYFSINVNNNEKRVAKDVTLNFSGASVCFKGRSQTLKDIFNYFKSNNIVVIHGAPGFGKTETARQFAIKNAKHYDRNLIWIFAETQDNIKKCFTELARKFGPNPLEVSEMYNQFKFTRCLFIFDNAENMASIREYLPSSQLHPTVKILITSQISEWSNSVSKVPLESLNLKDSLQIMEAKLADKYEEYEIEIWEGLVEHFERIPLSLQIVSSLIKEELSKVQISTINLKKLISDLKVNFINSKIPESEISNYNKTVFSSIRFVLNRLKKDDGNLSLEILCFIAYLDTDNIYHGDLLFLPTIKESEEKLKLALTELVKYSLIQVERDFISDRLKIKVHRTIQLILRKYDLNEQNGLIFKTAIKTILLSQMEYHFYSLFKYVKEEEFREKSLEFYDENKNLENVYLLKLARVHCNVILEEILPKFIKENENYHKVINEMLYAAINNENSNMFTIDLLIKYQAQIYISPYYHNANGFHLASNWLSIKLFDRILESNNYENVINSKNEYNQTILHLLVEKCNKENVERTIECIDHLVSKWKADISIRNYKTSDTILHILCKKNIICFQLIKYLLEKCNCKYLLNTQNARLETPLQNLFRCNEFRSESFVSSDSLKNVSYYLLKDCDANITIEDESKWNTLFYACHYATAEIIDFVLKTKNCRQFINNQDRNGDVAFTQLNYNKLITEQEINELMKLFIENEMDFKLRNNEDMTLINIAEEMKLMKLSNELRKHLKLPPRSSSCSLM